METPKISLSHPHAWFIIAAIMLSTIMEILDTTIVTVSLPHMMGSLSADRDQISWVLTSYIVAAGILMPLTGFLVGLFGSKRLLLINIVGFMIASALCGLSANLGEMVFFRLLQGLFGASLVPLSQFILRDTFTTEDQPKVMALWGMGVMAAPIMGPSLGGYITDTLNWRWIFYINIPVCVLNFFLVTTFLKQSVLRKDIIDWTGMIFMIISIGALQLFLDRGEVDDWFSSTTICWLFIIFVCTFIFFIYHCLKAKNPIINLRLFQDRTFAYGTLMMTLFAASVLGCITLFPQMLETLFNYSSNLSGITMAPRGVASGIMMGIASQLMSRGVSTRWVITAGLMVGAYTTWVMGNMSLDTGMPFILILGFVQGLGIGCFFMPLSTIVYRNLPRASIAEASGLFNFGRSIGNAIGISLLTTYLDRDTQANWHALTAHIYAANPNFTHWLAVQNFTLNNPHSWVGQLGQQISDQANFMAYSHTFKIAALILFAAAFLPLLLKTPANAIPNNLEAAAAH
jgi:MFS transporter, DHA2 family, multidrug resistance protein